MGTFSHEPFGTVTVETKDLELNVGRKIVRNQILIERVSCPPQLPTVSFPPAVDMIQREKINPSLPTTRAGWRSAAVVRKYDHLSLSIQGLVPLPYSFSIGNSIQAALCGFAPSILRVMFFVIREDTIPVLLVVRSPLNPVRHRILLPPVLSGGADPFSVLPIIRYSPLAETGRVFLPVSTHILNRAGFLSGLWGGR